MKTITKWQYNCAKRHLPKDQYKIDWKRDFTKKTVDGRWIHKVCIYIIAVNRGGVNCTPEFKCSTPVFFFRFISFIVCTIKYHFIYFQKFQKLQYLGSNCAHDVHTNTDQMRENESVPITIMVTEHHTMKVIASVLLP
jgi:hypothetical protein